MSLRLAGLLSPVALLLAVGTAPAQHHGGGGHMGGGHMGGYHGGGYHGGGYVGGFHGGYHHGGYVGGFRGGYYGGYGLGGFGYPYLGYGLGGYGLGGYGYGLGGYPLGYGYRGYGLGTGYSYGYGYPYLSRGYGYTAPAAALIGTPAVVSSLYTPAPDTGTAMTTGTAEPAPATVTILVPADAQVWFEGKEEKTGGTSRVFKSAPLQPGQSYVLPVKARWGGSTREMQLPVRAGDKTTVDLNQL